MDVNGVWPVKTKATATTNDHNISITCLAVLPAELPYPDLHTSGKKKNTTTTTNNKQQTKRRWKHIIMVYGRHKKKKK